MMFRVEVAIVCIYLSAVLAKGQERIVGEISIKGEHKVVYMECNVINKKSSSMVFWAKREPSGENRFLADASGHLGTLSYRYSVRNRTVGARTTFTLKIRDLTEADAGEYKCYIQQSGVPVAQWPKKTVVLSTLVAPQIQTYPGHVHEIDIGESRNISCRAYGIPTPNITWKREDGRPIHGGKIYKWGYYAILELNNVTKDSAGKYVCVANNNVGSPATKVEEVRVFYKPLCRKAEEPNDGQIQSGQRFSAELKCICNGYLPPSIHWEKYEHMGWRNIDEDDKYGIANVTQKDATLSTLLVRNVLANDYTQYRCTGSNRAGQDTTEFKLQETRE